MTIAKHFFLDRDFGDRRRLQRKLLGQRLGQLLLVDEPHVDRDFAQQLARMLVLLIDQQLLLFIGDEPHVDQNLSNTAMCHR